MISQKIIQIAYNSKHSGLSNNFTHKSSAKNSLCGDKIKLERFAVLGEARGKGVGAALVNAVVKDVENSTETGQMYMHAQVID